MKDNLRSLVPWAVTAALSVIVLVAVAKSAPKTDSVVPARAEPTVPVIHGEDIPDYARWLRESDAPEARQWRERFGVTREVPWRR